MPAPAPSDKLIRDLLASFDAVFGLHPASAPSTPKASCAPARSPPAAAAKLTRAPHVNQPSTRVVVRLSDFAGIPDIPDNHPEAASPRGIAIRFYLGEHVHTDIVAHSADGFPVRTGEEFLELNRAVAASPPTCAPSVADRNISWPRIPRLSVSCRCPSRSRPASPANPSSPSPRISIHDMRKA